jgi:hypothetical protein
VSAGLAHGAQARPAMNRNTRTGLVLAAVALAFFLAIIAKYWLIR